MSYAVEDVFCSLQVYVSQDYQGVWSTLFSLTSIPKYTAVPVMIVMRAGSHIVQSMMETTSSALLRIRGEREEGIQRAIKGAKSGTIGRL